MLSDRFPSFGQGSLLPTITVEVSTEHDVDKDSFWWLVIVKGACTVTRLVVFAVVLRHNLRFSNAADFNVSTSEKLSVADDALQKFTDQ